MLFSQKQIPADILSLPGSVFHDLLLITCYLLPVTYYLLLVTYYLLPITHYLLYCLLPIIRYITINYYFYILNFRYSSGFR